MTLRNDGRPVFSAHDCNRRGELGIRLTIDTSNQEQFRQRGGALPAQR